MIIIHGVAVPAIPGLVAASLPDRLRVLPAVVVGGARQTGTRTPAHELAPNGGRERC
jgi:hypothetical protein